MKEVKLSGIEYIGCDIVADVINENAEKFGGDKIHFVHCNALEDELPDADVILAREILFHLSFADIFSVLRNAVSKQRNWLFITSDQLSSFNTDICSGDWRLLNLQRAPFNFPNPVYSIDDSGVCPNRKLMAWTGAQISETLRS
jgi:hypothetical protein